MHDRIYCVLLLDAIAAVIAIANANTRNNENEQGS